MFAGVPFASVVVKGYFKLAVCLSGEARARLLGRVTPPPTSLISMLTYVDQRTATLTPNVKT